MRGVKLLESYEDNWETSKGAWFPGQRVVLEGVDLFKDLSRMRWLELMIFSVQGKKYTENQIKLFESIFVISVSFPDPRLWNNRIAALAATARSTTVMALSAATAASEAEIYGHKPMMRAFLFLQKAKKHIDAGEDLVEIVLDEAKKKRVVPGYGRPIVDEDERIEPLLTYAQELGLGNGEYVKLAFEIEKITLAQRYRMQMNIAALAAALLLDQDMSLEEYDECSAFNFVGGMIPCHADALSKPEGALFPLKTDRINSTGHHYRSWNSE